MEGKKKKLTMMMMIIIIIIMCVKRLRNITSKMNIYNSIYTFQIRLSYRSSSRHCLSGRRRAKVHEPCFIQLCKAGVKIFTTHHIASHHNSAHQGLVTWIKVSYPSGDGSKTRQQRYTNFTVCRCMSSALSHRANRVH